MLALGIRNFSLCIYGWKWLFIILGIGGIRTCINCKCQKEKKLQLYRMIIN